MTRVRAVWMMVVTLASGACGGGKTDTPGGPAPTIVAGDTLKADLVGSGSTFAYPLYAKWAVDYGAKTGVHIAYKSIGSGAGVREFSGGLTDFGGTDGPMSDQEIAVAKGGPVLHVPTALGADVLIYNLVQVIAPLKFTPAVIADIFLGKIKKWNDPRLKDLNPDVRLPSEDILVVHRTDGSGTTYVWTDYLSRVSPEWAAGPGRGRQVQWPVGVGGDGNEGVADKVKEVPGAVGYAELAYAHPHLLPRGMVQNAAGNFIMPSVESITAAAATVAEHLPATTDFRMSIIDAPGAAAYPISSFTWILVYRNQPDSVKGRKLVEFLRWGLSDGQRVETSLEYAPLPESMLVPIRAKIDSVRIGRGASSTTAAKGA